MYVYVARFLFYEECVVRVMILLCGKILLSVLIGQTKLPLLGGNTVQPTSLISVLVVINIFDKADVSTYYLHLYLQCK